MADIDTSTIIRSANLKYEEGTFADRGRSFDDARLSSRLFGDGGIASSDSALSSTLKGIDIFNNPTPAQQTHEQHGLVFFTRPMLNLSYHNTSVEPTLTPLMTKEKVSIGAYVRAMLDPLNNLKHPDFNCPLVDRENAFIPLLSNTVETLSGWQDPMLQTWTSAAGVNRQAYTLADSTNDVFEPVDLSSTFRSVRGNILSYMFHVWQTYIARTLQGRIDSHPVFYQHNAVDYGTRIYSLVLDQTRTYVQEIACSGMSFPLTNPAGARANYNRSEVLNREVDTLNQTWRSMGLFYYHPGYMYDFNEISGALRPHFNDPNQRNKYYRILWPREYKMFTYQAFPRINPRTARLEWWISREKYKQIVGSEQYAGMPTDN